MVAKTPQNELKRSDSKRGSGNTRMFAMESQNALIYSLHCICKRPTCVSSCSLSLSSSFLAFFSATGTL